MTTVDNCGGRRAVSLESPRPARAAGFSRLTSPVEHADRRSEASVVSARGTAHSPLAENGPARTSQALWVAAAAMAAVLITHLVDFGSSLGLRVLDATSSSSWSHRADAATIVTAAVVVAIAGWRARVNRGLAAMTTVILGFLGGAEISSLHAQIDQSSVGKAVYAPALLALVFCVWRLTADEAQHEIAVTGLVTLTLSFAIHVLGPPVLHLLGWGSSGWPYQVKVGLKQGTEFAGWLLVLWALSRTMTASWTPPRNVSLPCNRCWSAPHRR